MLLIIANFTLMFFYEFSMNFQNGFIGCNIGRDSFRKFFHKDTDPFIPIPIGYSMLFQFHFETELASGPKAASNTSSKSAIETLCSDTD